MQSASWQVVRRPRYFFVVALVLLVACGHAAPALPTGSTTPFAEFAPAYAEASGSCRATRTLTVSMALSGKANGVRLRGRVDAGFAAPAAMRLEGRAPFGRPVFVLTSEADRATLVLPRDERVLAGASPSAIVEALAGVALTPDALRSILSGCGLAVGESPTGGRAYTGGWAAVDVAGTTTYLRRSGTAWQILGAAHEALTVFYADFQNGRPGTVHIQTGRTSGSADLILRLSQIEVNPTLDPRTFHQEIPPQASPLTLDELRRSGPLGDAKGAAGDPQ